MRLLIFALLLAPVGVQAQNALAPDSALARELRARVSLDQSARTLLMLRGQSGQQMDRREMRLVATIDSLNTEWLRAVVQRSGWPRRSQVGEVGAHDAWLLAQHADQDSAFQAEVLRRMEALVPEREVSGADFAYLTDRVRIAQGRPQRFGTQVQIQGTKLVIHPIEDEAGVDQRRRSVGLPPLSEYIAQLRQVYGVPQ